MPAPFRTDPACLKRDGVSKPRKWNTQGGASGTGPGGRCRGVSGAGAGAGAGGRPRRARRRGARAGARTSAPRPARRPCTRPAAHAGRRRGGRRPSRLAASSPMAVASSSSPPSGTQPWGQGIEAAVPHSRQIIGRIGCTVQTPVATITRESAGQAPSGVGAPRSTPAAAMRERSAVEASTWEAQEWAHSPRQARVGREAYSAWSWSSAPGSRSAPAAVPPPAGAGAGCAWRSRRARGRGDTCSS